MRTTSTVIASLCIAATAACGGKPTPVSAADSMTPTPMADAPKTAAPETVFVAQVPPPAPRRPARQSPPPPPRSNPNSPAPAPSGRGIIESGTDIKTTLVDSIHSGYNGPGDPIHATVANDVTDNGRVVIPAGSVVTFRITAIGPATSRGEKGTLGISSESIQINGRSYAIHGTASEYDFEMRARSVNAGDVATAAGGAGIGAIIGHVIGGKTGTIIGAIGGGAIGTAQAAKNADRDIIVHAGTTINLVLLDAFER